MLPTTSVGPTSAFFVKAVEIHSIFLPLNDNEIEYCDAFLVVLFFVLSLSDEESLCIGSKYWVRVPCVFCSKIFDKGKSNKICIAEEFCPLNSYLIRMFLCDQGFFSFFARTLKARITLTCFLV